MSDARAEILARLNGTLTAGAPIETRHANAAARLAAPPRVGAPARVQNVDLVETFRTRAEDVGATTTRVTSRAGIGEAVADYLRAHNLGTAIKLSPELAGKGVVWPQTFEVSQGRADGTETVGIALARAGVAETGTLVLSAGPERPTTLNYLPEAHVVVVPSARVVGTYEEMWDRIREPGLLPRVVNWITGPSRTADIEQTLLVGVHGPKRLHIVVVDEEL
jgi:L-lactate dehydrogenase complex protein LldG